MSTANTALSIPMKMAPGPDNRQEPMAPDRIDEKSSEVVTTATNTATNVLAVAPPTDVPAAVTVASAATSAPIAGTNALVSSSNINNHAVTSTSTSSSEIITNSNATDNAEFVTSTNANANAAPDSKQEEPANVSHLNEGELQALLNEALTYKSPKDREGKSNLFKELLQEVEADETEERRRTVVNSRCIPGSNRRRHKRDSVSERLTHGGSLQNLAQPINSEFDSSFAYLTSGSSHTYGGGRRKGKKHSGPSVSARQREGGSLPSNVNASHSLASLANLDIVFDKKKRYSEERSVVYDWTNKEKSKSLDKPSYGCAKKDEKDKKELTKRESTSVIAIPCETELETREKKSVKGKSVTNEMPESDNPPPEYKPDYMVIDFDFEVDAFSDRNAIPSSGVTSQRPQSIETEDDEGTEMKIIEPRRGVQEVISRDNFGAPQTPVDTAIEFPLRDQTSKQTDKSTTKTLSLNGNESSVASGATPIQTYNSVKCVVSGTVNFTSTQQAKVISSSLYSVMPVSWPSPNIAMEAVSRLTAQHIPSGEKKSLDENGNAVQGHNGERKKTRRKHTQEPNVIVYKAENVEGHRNIEDIDTIVEFIENKESKGKKGKASNAVRVKATSGTKPRTREKDSKREQLPAKLQKSNSLEEISKTKLEDLTAEKSTCSSGASSISSQHGAINVALRRAKQRSTGDSAVDSRGDRRSWGTEEGQSIYCNDTGDDYTTRRNSTRKMNNEAETETEFLVVTKKKKSKKQRRSSSGSRAQNLASSGSYLQRTGGFTNDYRTPLSPELRRKSTSSMPPSDKSDSSDLDSVHSLPVTSNSSKHNSTKNATSPGSSGSGGSGAGGSGGGAPQASYADIARTATINMSHGGVLNIPTMVPNMLNTGTWPSVPTKSPSEPDKFPQDYYPSLDELQQSDRKLRQHSFAHTNHVHGLNLSFEKPPSPTHAKTTKRSSEAKKGDAREEAINKNIQVLKYVQDIEIHQSLTSQEQTQPKQQSVNAPINNNNNNNETTSAPKFNSVPTTCTLENEANTHDNISTRGNNNNANIHLRVTRWRRNYQQTPTQHNNPSPLQDSNPRGGEAPKSCVAGNEMSRNAALSLANHQEDKEIAKKSTNLRNLSSSSSSQEDNLESAKTTKIAARTTGNQQQNSPPSDSDNSSRSGATKTERLARALKDQQGLAKSDVNLKTACAQNSKRERSQDSKQRSKQHPATRSDREAGRKVSDAQHATNRDSATSARPAVILMDENSSDLTRNSDSPSELTFGFEVNEQLLLSEDNEESRNDEGVINFSNEKTLVFNKPPPNYVNRPIPVFEKQQQHQQHQHHHHHHQQQQQQHVRYDKFPTNFPMHPPHMQQHHHHHHHHHHGIPHPQAMITPMPYLGCTPRFQPLPAYQQPPPPPPPPQPSSIMEKYNHQAKEDFSARFVAPEEAVNIHNYNHDKIVTFVGLAWDAVMREIPATAATGRVQYYSGQ